MANPNYCKGLDYQVAMEGAAESYARFQFSADASAYAQKKSRQHPEISWLVSLELMSGSLLHRRYKEGKRA